MQDNLQQKALLTLLRHEQSKIRSDDSMMNMYFSCFGKNREKIRQDLMIIDKLNDIIMMCLIQQEFHRALRYIILLRKYTDSLNTAVEHGADDAIISIMGRDLVKSK